MDQIASIDEMYGRLLGQERESERAAEIAFAVKDAIRQAAGSCIRCSVGLAPNAWLAKVASDLNKPDGLTMILPEQLPEAICHLDLTDLPGIASNMQRRLHDVGIACVAQLCAASEDDLAEAWDSRVLGTIWWHQLRGHDLPHRPTQRRTVGHSHVLPPAWRSDERAKAITVRLLHKAAARMRRLNYRADYLVLSLRYLDRRKWEQRAGIQLCRDTLTLIRAMEPLWNARPPGALLKVGVVLTHLVPEGSATLPLYADQAHLDVLADYMDELDRKYGQHTIYLGGMWGAQDTAPTRISFTQIPELDDFDK